MNHFVDVHALLQALIAAMGAGNSKDVHAMLQALAAAMKLRPKKTSLIRRQTKRNTGNDARRFPPPSQQCCDAPSAF